MVNKTSKTTENNESIELGGNIHLTRFDLNNQEMIVAKKIIGNHAKKIGNHVKYKELKMELRTHMKGKTKNFEVKAELFADEGVFSAQKQGFNVFVLISEVLDKITNEIEHKIRK
jgi:ribosome-associated translation inhibitor RaiA